MTPTGAIMIAKLRVLHDRDQTHRVTNELPTPGSLMIVQSTAHPFADCGWQNTSSLGATILSSASRKQMHRTLDANAAKNLGE